VPSPPPAVPKDPPLASAQLSGRNTAREWEDSGEEEEEEEEEAQEAEKEEEEEKAGRG